MGKVSWPSNAELDEMKKLVAEIAGRCTEDVRVVVSPYRICPLGAHVDHQGGTVSAMTINKGILLGFVPSGDSQVILHSGQFKGEVRFSVDKILHPIHIVKASDNINESGASKLQQECTWGNYAKGALYALQSRGNVLTQGIIGFVSGSEDLDSSGLSSSAAVGVAYLLAFESANNLDASPTENIEYDRLIENEYLGLKNGILDQSAILLSSYGCLTCMNCKTKEHKLVRLPEFQNLETEKPKAYRILLAFSGLKQALTSNPGYNRRVAECQEAARLLLHATGNEAIEPLLSNVEPAAYETHKSKLEPTLARRAEHYFSENVRVAKGLDAWASGKLEDFGKLISASGLSSIQNYECGCEPLIQLYEILVRAPGVYGARFSGAGFRGCCIAFVDADSANEAASFVRNEYQKLQPKLASQIKSKKAVLICDPGDCAHVI
ncbi:galacturonokinase isoform X2 [Rhododendron vialii]|uniref:galacturonokinase isoform X2 n=1 Tax=Rhododendron vialii TaxID=182163 RepID=UPI00265DD7BA|nr:galacturonokinase isoform X2 [Rhododendron vialii]